MQLKSQTGKARDWKVIAAVATASALGVSGLALADTGGPDRAPDAINLRDRAEISQLNSQVETPSSEFPPLVFSVESTDDSPLDDNSPSTDSLVESLDVASVSVDDSPDDDSAQSAAAESVSAESVSADSASADSGSEDSFDDSADS
jgi:hypothetical protein